MKTDLKNVEFLFVSENVLSASKNTLRSLYILLGRQLQDIGALAWGNSPESFAEIRLYTQLIARSYEHTFQLVPSNIFTKPIEVIQRLETAYWEQVLEDSSRPKGIKFIHDIQPSERISCYIPTREILRSNRRFLYSGLNEKLLRVSNKNSIKFSPELNTDTPEHKHFFDKLGYEVLGPVFCSYALWILAQSVSTSYFGLMREGFFLGRVLSELGGTVDGQLYISRLTSLRAALAEPDEEEALLNFLIRSRSKPVNLGFAAKGLGICHTGNLPLAPSTLIVSENVQEVISWLNQTKIKDQRLAEARISRDNLMCHIYKIIGQEEKDLHILDMGYAGNILANLDKVFTSQKLKIKCRGRFLISSVGALWAQKRGCEILGFLSQNSAPIDFSSKYLRTPEILELCCSVKLGSTVGYDNEGGPISEPPPLPEWQYQEIDAVQEGVIKFVRDWKNENNKFTIPELSSLDTNSMATVARRLLIRLIERPSVEEAKHLGRWLYDDSLEENKLRSLTEYCSVKSSPSDFSRAELYWPQAWTVLQQNE